MDISAALDVGDGYFLGVSDEINAPVPLTVNATGLAGSSYLWATGFPRDEAELTRQVQADMERA